MAEPITRPTGASVAAFLSAIPDADIRKDCKAIARMLQAITKAKGKMWGADIVGFGEYTITYAGGRESDWPVAAFAPRKGTITLYLGGLKQEAALLKKLGKHKIGGGCLHIRQLADVDVGTLETLVKASVRRRS